jgi:hypothetical protein
MVNPSLTLNQRALNHSSGRIFSSLVTRSPIRGTGEPRVLALSTGLLFGIALSAKIKAAVRLKCGNPALERQQERRPQ